MWVARMTFCINDDQIVDLREQLIWVWRWRLAGCRAAGDGWFMVYMLEIYVVLAVAAWPPIATTQGWGGGGGQASATPGSGRAYLTVSPQCCLSGVRRPLWATDRLTEDIMLRSSSRLCSLARLAGRQPAAAYSAPAIPQPITAPDVPYTGVSVPDTLYTKPNLSVKASL